MTDAAFIFAEFFRAHGRFPEIFPPKTIEDFIVRRMLLEHDIAFTYCTDKFSCARYVAQAIGQEYLPQRFWSGSKISDIPLASLPRKFIVKTNHGCGQNIIVDKEFDESLRLMKERVPEWLTQNLYLKTREWQYKNIPPTVLVEELLEEEGLGAPRDYKIYCIGGDVHAIRVVDGMPKSKRARIYDKTWKLLPIAWAKRLAPNNYYVYPQSPIIPAPENLGELIDVAKELSSPFSFVRVDLYNVAGRIYFGEMTFTPFNAAWTIQPLSSNREIAAQLLIAAANKNKRRELDALIKRA